MWGGDSIFVTLLLTTIYNLQNQKHGHFPLLGLKANIDEILFGERFYALTSEQTV